MNVPRSFVKSLLRQFGLEVRRGAGASVGFPLELTTEECDLIRRVRESNLTMASYERLFATAMACKHVSAQGIKGDFVECGVWRGGNSIVAASILRLSGPERKVFLYDTFSGMTKPSDSDVLLETGEPAIEKFALTDIGEGSTWCMASMAEVSANLAAFGIDSHAVRLIKGDVSHTLDQPENLPDQIAVLRLDTDWYESTRKELEVLYPRLVSGGVLIIDDYGHWAGSKIAVDEYFSRLGYRPFFQYTDKTGRCAVKP